MELHNFFNLMLKTISEEQMISKWLKRPLGKTKLCIRNKKISDQIKQQALLFSLFKITSKQDNKARNSEEGNVNTWERQRETMKLSQRKPWEWLAGCLPPPQEMQISQRIRQSPGSTWKSEQQKRPSA